MDLGNKQYRDSSSTSTSTATIDKSASEHAYLAQDIPTISNLLLLANFLHIQVSMAVIHELFI